MPGCAGDWRSLQPRLIDGVLYVPARAETDGWLGDGMLPLAPDDPDYDTWMEEVDPEELQAAGWSEDEHPRWPAGSEHGGEFRPKEGGALVSEARLGPQPDGTFRVSKGPNLRDWLLNHQWDVPHDILDAWPNLSAEQANRLRTLLSSPDMQRRLSERGMGAIRKEAQWVLRDLGEGTTIPKVEQLPVTSAGRSLLDKLEIGGGRNADNMLEAARTVDRTMKYPRVPGEPTIEVKGAPSTRQRDASFWRGGGSLKPNKIIVAANAHDPISSVTHELGHYLDSLLGQDDWAAQGVLPPVRWNDYSSLQANGTLQRVLAAVKETEMYRQLDEVSRDRFRAHYSGFEYGGRTFAPGVSHIKYLLSPPEMIARSFEQYIAARNPDSKLATSVRHSEEAATYPGYMRGDDLEYVNHAWDTVLEQRGLLKRKVSGT